MTYTGAMHVTGFSPEIGRNPRILILGSMPGIRSIEAGEYYAHPRNAFWRIMESLGFVRPGVAYEERLRELLDHGIALWDVLDRCERPGSLDSAIRAASEIANDIRGLLMEYPSIRRVLLNGGKADQAFARHIRPTLDRDVWDRLLVVRLPSTSPAHAVPFTEKLGAWQRAIVKESGTPPRGGGT